MMKYEMKKSAIMSTASINVFIRVIICMSSIPSSARASLMARVLKPISFRALMVSSSFLTSST